jgi:hypothetical protein
VQHTLAQLLERSVGKIKIVSMRRWESRDAQARRAAEAARCARDQAKFCEYHDLPYTEPPSGTPDELERDTGQVGLDVPAFGRCLSGSVHRAAVQRAIDEGDRLGINGTMHFSSMADASPAPSFRIQGSSAAPAAHVLG